MTEELRFAVAMSGGVSLAVWMGGVAREINLLQQASNTRVNESASGSAGQSVGAGDAAQSPDGPSAPGTPDQDARCRDLYLKLLGLLDVSVTVDVLSGTSAGGINAALLGLSSAAGVDLAGLRELWLTTGSMDALLRDPGEKDPPSLMQGDKVLFNGLNRGIRLLYDNGRGDPVLAPPKHAADTTVFITTTMMSGETSRFTDDYGTLVPDVNHHGLFTFDQSALAPTEGGPALTALALAARSSASFPGAFEPSFVPIGAQIPSVQGLPERPDMAPFANMTRSHWVADGGLLANRPLTPLLARVFAQPARGQVRRVLAFVVPDGGGTPRPAPQPDPDLWQRPPTMAAALKKDLNAQLAQSIATDLEAVRNHNQRLKAGHYLRRYLLEMGARLPGDGGLVTSGLLHAYQQQQGTGLAQPLLDEVMFKLTSMKLPDSWANELSAGMQPVQTQMAKKMVQILGAGWRTGPRAGSNAAATPEGDKAAAWAAWTAADGSFDRAAAFGLPVFHGAQATAIHLVRLGYQRATGPIEREKMIGHRANIEATYQASSPAWDERAEVSKRLDEAAATNPVPDLVTVAADLADAKRQALLIGPPPEPPPAEAFQAYTVKAAEISAAWEALAAAVAGLLTDLAPLTSPDGRQSRHEAAEGISSYLRYFGPAPTPGGLTDRLLNLVIAKRAVEPAEPEVDQPVEFIQVSANTRTLLAKNQLDTVSKLRGVELHHFAAFYKNSWRAYDWMWGRMDGSGWLVHILLDPRRILSVIEDQYQWPHGSRAKNFAQLLRETLGLPLGLQDDCLEKDLAFLDKPEAPIPTSLPNSALFLAQAWQNVIAANELPTIARQIITDNRHLPPLPDHRNTTGPQPTPTTAWVRGVWHKRASKHRQNQPLNGSPDPWTTNVLTMQHQNKEPAEFARQLPGCPVRLETLAGQMHTAAFARLAAKAAAVLTAAIASAPEAPGSVRPVLVSARTVTRTGYMATKVTGGSGWKTLIAGLVLAVIGGVMATQGLIAIGVTGTVAALAGFYLIALGAWGIHRGLLGALIAITGLALAGSLTLAWVREQIWGTVARKGSSGLVPMHVLPWLRSTWWGGLAIIGGFLLLAALFGTLTRRRTRRNRGTPIAAKTDGSQPGPAPQPPPEPEPQPTPEPGPLLEPKPAS